MTRPFPQRLLHSTTLALGLIVCVGLALAHARPAQAATCTAQACIVTDCTAQGLVDAMNYMNNNIKDGIITFNCSNVNASATISITYPGGYSVASNAAYTIDGGNVITLTGLDANRLLQVQANAALTLTNISLIHGNAGADVGGCLYNFSGMLRLDNVTMQYCQTADGYTGGAIDNNSGTLTVIGSRILSSTTSYGGGIESGYGTLTLLGSTLAYNRAINGTGGALDVVGSVTISNSQIYGNQASGTNSLGGGLNVGSGSSVTINSSLFASNVVTSTNLGDGGGIANRGILTITNSTLSGNSATNGGGGIYNTDTGTVTLTNVTLVGNSADIGGGVYQFSGAATLTNVTLSGNSATDGGGIYHNGGTAKLTNVTLSGNLGYNITGGIYHAGGTFYVKNTLFERGLNGRNCTGFSGGLSNMSDDISCGFGTGRDGVPNLNLGPLADNGGFTKTHLPGAGSAAIDNGTNSGCPATDQRGFRRPIGLACDVGAVEVPLSLFLPLIVR